MFIRSKWALLHCFRANVYAFARELQVIDYARRFSLQLIRGLINFIEADPIIPLHTGRSNSYAY